MRTSFLKCLAIVAALLFALAWAAGPAFAGKSTKTGTTTTTTTGYGQPNVGPTPIEDPNLNPYMDATGTVDSFDTKNNLITIDDCTRKLASGVVFKSVPPSVTTKSSFVKGKKVGFRLNSKGEIVILYLLLK